MTWCSGRTSSAGRRATGELGTMLSRRDAGQVTEFGVSKDRVWDLLLKKLPNIIKSVRR